MNSENLSVPTESDIDMLITGIITPKPTNSIIELINDKNKLKNMSANALRIAKPGATKDIVKNILEVAKV